jgi:SET domain
MMANDPFQLFDDSDDENDGTNDDLSNGESKRSAITDLVRQANARKASLFQEVDMSRTSGVSECTGDAHHCVSSSPPDIVPHSQDSDKGIVEINDLKWNDPEYRGPISLVGSGSHIGGGRMLIASRDILPGTLLLLEKPLATWSSEDNHLDMAFVRKIVSSCSDIQKLIHHVEDLHPGKSVVDQVNGPKITSDTDQVKQMMQSLDSQYENDKDIEDILMEFAIQNVCNADGTPVSRLDLLRFMLAMRYNALETGLYMYTAMLNHSDMPNCVKFKGAGLSEVRATRLVRWGEMLTISYVPNLLSHASRRWHLWQQHRFDIGTDLPDDLKQLELIAGSLPQSSIDEAVGNTISKRIEATVHELSSHIGELEMAREVDQNVVIALELSSLELCRIADEQLQNENHILLLPCLRLHVDACALVQKTSIVASVRVKLLERFVCSARRLLSLQKLYHGPDHFDVARTDLDLAEGISELLSRNPSRMLSLERDTLQTTTQWASYEYELRKDFIRIKESYESR